MDLVLILSRLTLAATFLVAGLAKLADLRGTRTAIIGFGASPRTARALALMVPVAELAVAIALVPGTTAKWGALGAVLLLAVFIVAIAINLARGRTPDCRCFGQLKAAPIGAKTLVRNGLLIVLAVFTAWQGWHRGPSLIRALSGLSSRAQLGVAGGVVILTAVVFEGWVILSLVAQQGRLLARLEVVEDALKQGGSVSPLLAGLPVGDFAPEFALPSLDGGVVTLEQLRSAGRPVMLVFTDPDCGPCRELLPEIAAWHAEEANPFAVAVISREGGRYDRAGGPPVLVQAGDEVASLYRVAGMPSAVIIRADGIIAAPLVAGPDAIRDLVANMKGEPCLDPSRKGQGSTTNRPVLALPKAPQVGREAPSLVLPDLTGRTVDLAEFRGEEVALLFWSPDCGFCQQVLDEIQALETDPAARRLVFVSSGSIQDNQAMGLRSPVLLDDEGASLTSYGADGTPMAVLIDRDGKIASTMASGAPAVLSLVTSPPASVALSARTNGREP